MKKLLALLLAAVMVLGLAACGSGTSTPAETTAAPAASSDASADNAADTTAAATLDPVTIKIWFHGSNVTPDASKGHGAGQCLPEGQDQCHR